MHDRGGEAVAVGREPGYDDVVGEDERRDDPAGPRDDGVKDVRDVGVVAERA